MLRRMKRVGTLLLAVALVLALNACSSDEDYIEVLDYSDAQPEYLSFFSPQSMSGSDIGKYWIDQFTEKYNKKVYINFDSASYYAEKELSYRELLEKRLHSSSPDDMYIINAEDVMEFGKRGHWMDLSDMDFVDNLSEAALYQSTFNGQVFSLPLAFTGFGFLWNVDMLKEHNLTIPDNLEEFLDVCEKLKKEGILPYGANKGFSLTVPAMCAGLSQLYGSEDQQKRIEDLNSGKTPVSTYMRDGFMFLNEMIEKGYMDPEQALASTPQKEDLELFLSGKCAFICVGLGDIQEQEGKTFEMELTGLPVLAEGCAAVYGADMRLCINPGSKHLDTAREFVEMLGTSEALSETAAIRHTLSTAKDSDTSGFTMEQKLVQLLEQPEQIPNQDFALHFNTWESIRDVGRELCGGASVDESCALLDDKQRKELEEYRAE